MKARYFFAKEQLYFAEERIRFAKERFLCHSFSPNRDSLFPKSDLLRHFFRQSAIYFAIFFAKVRYLCQNAMMECNARQISQ
jgi:hypothetical protein